MCSGISSRRPREALGVTKQLLPPEGIEVPDGDIFWTRVLNDGDVVLADNAALPAPKQSGSDAE